MNILVLAINHSYLSTCAGNICEMQGYESPQQMGVLRLYLVVAGGLVQIRIVSLAIGYGE